MCKCKLFICVFLVTIVGSNSLASKALYQCLGSRPGPDGKIDIRVLVSSHDLDAKGIVLTVQEKRADESTWNLASSELVWIDIQDPTYMNFEGKTSSLHIINPQQYPNSLSTLTFHEMDDRGSRKIFEYGVYCQALK